MKKLFGIIAALTLTFVGVVGASAAQATAFPFDGYCTPTSEQQPNPDYRPGTPGVPAVIIQVEVIDHEAVDKWYSWTGGQADEHPFPSDNWQPDNGNHNGFPDIVGVYERPKGNSDNSAWFYHQVVGKVSHLEPKVITPEVPAIPAVGEPTITVNTGAICDVWITWQSPTWTPNATDANSIDWPQTFVGVGKIAPTVCETTYQQDHYIGTRHDLKALFDDGLLTGPNPPEDHALVTEWIIVSTTKCTPPPPGDNPSETPTPTPSDTPTETPTPTPTPTETTPPPGDDPTPTPSDTPTSTPTPTPTETTPVVVTPTPTSTTPVKAEIITAAPDESLAATGSWLERIAPWALGFITLGIAAVVLRYAGRKYSTKP